MINLDHPRSTTNNQDQPEPNISKQELGKTVLKSHAWFKTNGLVKRGVAYWWILPLVKESPYLFDMTKNNINLNSGVCISIVNGLAGGGSATSTTIASGFQSNTLKNKKNEEKNIIIYRFK